MARIAELNQGIKVANMHIDYQQRRFEHVKSADQEATETAHYPVIVIGAGPVGLTTAIDLAQQGVSTVLLDDDNTLANGSRAICFAKRTLDIWDRLGCGQRMVDKGVTWNLGKVFFRNDPVYSFDLLPEAGHRRPAFINLQQYYVEGFLQERAQEYPNLSIRWKNKVVGVTQAADYVELMIETPGGSYRLRADYAVAAEGARSTMRGLMGLQSKGRTFKDRFLIADVKVKAEFPSERWFWFDPPFHPNQSVLLHRQPDNIWRIDFQLGWDADPVVEKSPEKVIPRVKALLGSDVEFALEWVSVYTFSCLRMDRFRHGRVLFAGDAAHGVSPFGARGANSGVQDADNLAWKLKFVLDKKAPQGLLDTYGSEREYAADENILNSTRSTDFITPKSAISRIFRDAVLELSKDYSFARRLVNSGRLSLPSTYVASQLNTPDNDSFSGAMVPGAPSVDAPILVDGNENWFLALLGNEFTGVYFPGDSIRENGAARMLQSLAGEAGVGRSLAVFSRNVNIPRLPGSLAIVDAEGLLAQRYDARPGTFYLLRPDQHICARWRRLEVAKVRAAMARATCNNEMEHGHERKAQH
ncbi:MAG: 3-(3-hydroxy-phenyl)propionate hydroxylase [Burkholderiales bacterium]